MNIKWKRFSESDRSKRNYNKPPKGRFYLVVWDEDPEEIHYAGSTKCLGGSGWFADVADVVILPNKETEEASVIDMTNFHPLTTILLLALDEYTANQYCVDVLKFNLISKNQWQDPGTGIILKLCNSSEAAKGFDRDTIILRHSSIIVHPHYKKLISDINSRFKNVYESWNNLITKLEK